jgi:hypothetical protein
MRKVATQDAMEDVRRNPGKSSLFFLTVCRLVWNQIAWRYTNVTSKSVASLAASGAFLKTLENSIAYKYKHSSPYS